jgi:hypothetical protein
MSTQATKKERAENSYKWSLEADNTLGHLNLTWSTRLFRPQDAEIRVYEGTFPDNPDQRIKANTPDNFNNKPWNTGLDWGPGWACAYVGRNNQANGSKYVYIVQLTTQDE